jgi:hypothetical protein
MYCIMLVLLITAGTVMLTSRTPRAQPATSRICSSLFGESSSPGSSLSNHNNNHSSLLSLWNLKIMKDNYSTCPSCPVLCILRLLFLFLTSLAWRCENLFAHQSSPSHHIPLITAPSLRWSPAMGMINTKTIIYFSSLRQI